MRVTFCGGRVDLNNLNKLEEYLKTYNYKYDRDDIDKIDLAKHSIMIYKEDGKRDKFVRYIMSRNIKAATSCPSWNPVSIGSEDGLLEMWEYESYWRTTTIGYLTADDVIKKLKGAVENERL